MLYRSVGTTIHGHGALNLDFRDYHSFDAFAGLARSMKRCSYCGKQYPDDADICPVDRKRSLTRLISRETLGREARRDPRISSAIYGDPDGKGEAPCAESLAIHCRAANRSAALARTEARGAGHRDDRGCVRPKASLPGINTHPAIISKRSRTGSACRTHQVKPRTGIPMEDHAPPRFAAILIAALPLLSAARITQILA